MLTIPLQYQGLQLFRAPYHTCTPLDAESHPGNLRPGEAAVWFMRPGPRIAEELRWAALRPIGMPLFIVLPQPEEIPDLATILPALPNLKPKGVLPGAGRGTLTALRSLLGAPPPALHRAVADLLENTGAIAEPATRQRVELIFAAAPNVRSIHSLARQLCQSRRTLGRFFQERDLPVPSHWLQFARVLHTAIQLQNTSLSIGRVSARFGYPDGFTLSNTMKRLTGYRPSFVREHLGWEWIVEAWWMGETGEHNGQPIKRLGRGNISRVARPRGTHWPQ